jgi:hypothetical protein
MEGSRVRESQNSGSLKMKVLWSLKTMGTTNPATQHHVPEDIHPLQYCFENLRSCSVKLLVFFRKVLVKFVKLTIER